MNTFTLTSPFAPESTHQRHDSYSSPYATAAQTAAVLRSSAQYRRERMDAADMITTDEAAALAGTTRVTVNSWIKSGRCIGVAHLRRGSNYRAGSLSPPFGQHCSRLPNNLAHPMDGSYWRFWSLALPCWMARRPALRWSRARR
jgi:hypothetical protein